MGSLDYVQMTPSERLKSKSKFDMNMNVNAKTNRVLKL